MKSLKIKIENLKDELEKNILDREEIFDKRSEKWQDSEKGEAHSEVTDKLKDWFDELGDWVDEMESF